MTRFEKASPSEDDELQLLAVLCDSAAIERLGSAFQGARIRVSLASELSTGRAMLFANPPQLALVDLHLEDRGLTFLHQIRTLSPETAILAIVPAERPELGQQARALGARTVPLFTSDDQLWAALSNLRPGRFGVKALAPSAGERALLDLAADVAELADTGSRRILAERLAQLFRSRLEAESVLVYLGADESSRHLMRVAAANPRGTEPSFGEELEILRYATQNGFEVARLALRREQFGLILLGGLASSERTEALLSLTASLATLLLVLVGAREQSSREAIKDSESGAYTFAYFVDLAGREIRMARRHGGRFAVATIGLGAQQDGARASREPSAETAETVLAAVRDTDVLARVGAHELYLLLPQTGGLAAQACRRRILSLLRAATPSGSTPAVFGLAAFPHDGKDLSRLLRVAKHRADASIDSVVERFRLDRLALGDLLDTLLGPVALEAARVGKDSQALRYIELPTMDAIELALAAVSEAARAGEARVIATQHAGISIGGAIRSELAREMEEVRVEVLDVSPIPGAENADILLVGAQHLSYALVGRSESGLVRAIHTSDPLVSDLLIARLSEAFAPRPEQL